MKRIVTGALALMMMTGAAQAQQQEGGQAPRTEHRKGQHKGDRFQNLNLTADQQVRMKEAREAYAKAAAELKKQDQLSVADMRTRRQALHQQYRNQVASILTKEQKDQLARQKAEWKQEGRAGKGGQFGNRGHRSDSSAVRSGAGRNFGADLNLTAEQKERMDQLRAAYRPQFQALRQDQSLSEAQKKTRFAELSRKQREELKALLTPEQVQKLESARQKRAARHTK
ncbi:MAG TPA: hypothetical protein VHK69_15000 [Chitinophagaceae bacterium]|jgi:Spy/CpxP family protein refolding chaperone|nr:hypothetical protein [Chitinophagaceae bacterium]